MNPDVDFFFEKEGPWQKSYQLLRNMVLDCGLEEALKWGQPCYTFQGGNVVLIHGFKEYCALLFFKGALLADPKSKLIQQTANVQSARQMRFTGAKEITAAKPIIKSYIYEAIEVEKAGLNVTMKKTSEYSVCEEFRVKLTKSASLRKAFEALTPGRQRGYLLHFSAAKQSATRMARVEKAIPRIMKGKGLTD